MAKDISITFDMNGGTGGVEISLATLRSIRRIILEEVRKEARKIAELMVHRIHMRYQEQLRGATRKGADSVINRLTDSFMQIVESQADGGVDVHVFNLEHARKQTSGGADKIEYPGWFQLLEDGHTGRGHASSTHGFISLGYALELAQACIEMYHMKPPKSLEFLQYVRDNFAGKSGEGIMIPVGAPVFYAYPDFGKAITHGILPHPGFEAWNILQSEAQTGRRYLNLLVTRAVENARRRIMRGDT